MRSTPGRLVNVITLLTSACLLYSRFRFGDQMAFMPAVSEVNSQADDEPYNKTDPCGDIEEGHHCEAHNHAENRNHGNERRSVRAWSFRMRAPHDDHADTNDHEGQKG